MLKTLRNFAKRFFLDSYCLSCKSPRTEGFYHICPQCVPNLKLVKDQNNICPLCHDTWVVDGVCKNCNNTPPPWSKLHTIFCYKDALKQMFHLYKFKDSVLAEKDLVKLLTPYIAMYKNYHFVIVPCSKSTRRRLGFNPVTQILRQITNNYSEPFNNESTTTIKSLGRVGRKTSHSNITFDKTLLKQEDNIILIDDIFTTGSTMNQVSTLLKNHNINTFDALCFFRS